MRYDTPRNESDLWINDFVHNAPPKGESFSQLYQRIKKFLENIPQNIKGDVVIISHAGCIRAIYTYVNKIPLEDIFNKCNPQYGSITTLRYNRPT